MSSRLNSRRRKLLRAGLATLAAGALTGCDLRGDGVDARTTLRVAKFKIGELDFFEDAGVDDFPYPVRNYEFASSNSLLEAMAAGSVDIGMSSDVTPIFLAPRGAPVKQIAVIEPDPYNYSAIVPNDSPMRDIREIRGKRIAYLRATAPHYLMLRILEDQGLTTQDVRPVPMLQQDAYPAFRSGQFDMWMVGGIFSARAERDGGRVLQRGEGYIRNNAVIVANADQAADASKHAIMSDWLSRLARVIEWMESNHEDTAAKLSRRSGAPAELFLEQFARRKTRAHLVPVSDRSVESQQLIADTFARAGYLPRGVRVDSLWDWTFEFGDRHA